MSRLRFINVLLLITSVLVALVLGDILLQRVVPDSIIDKKDYYSSDAYFGWTYAKGKDFDSYNAFGERVHLRFSGDGFRLWHVPEESRAAKRIVYLGDSVVGAIQVNQADHFIERVDLENAKHGVVSAGFNYGVNGFSTDQELMVLDRYIKSVKPDLVVCLVVDNDFPFLDTDRFIVNKVLYGKPRVRFNAEQWEIVEAPFSKVEIPQSWFARLVSKSLIISRLRRLWQERRALDPDRSEGDFQTLNSHLEWESLIAARKESSLGTENWRVFNRLIAAMDRIARSNGAHFLLVPFPDPWSMVPEARAVLERNGAKPDLLIENILSHARQLDVRAAANTLSWVHSETLAAEERKKLYFIKNNQIFDGHLTSFGHAAFAELLAPVIRSSLEESR